MSINVTHGDTGTGTALAEGAVLGVAGIGEGMHLARQDQLLDAHIESAEAQAVQDKLNAERAQRVADIARQRREAAQAQSQAQGALHSEVQAGTSWDDLGEIATSAGLAPMFGPRSSIGLEEGTDYPSVLNDTALDTAAKVSENPKEYAKWMEGLVARQAQVMTEAENAAVGELAQELGMKGTITPEEANRYTQELATGDTTAADVFQALQVRQKYAKGVLKAQRKQAEAQATIEALASPEWKNSASKEDREYVADIQAEFESGGTLLQDPDELVAKVKVKVLGLEEYHEQEKATARAEGMAAAMHAMAEEFGRGQFPVAGLLPYGDKAPGSAQDASAANVAGESTQAATEAAAPAQEASNPSPFSAENAPGAERLPTARQVSEGVAKSAGEARKFAKLSEVGSARRRAAGNQLARFWQGLTLKLDSKEITGEQANAEIEAFVRDVLRLDITPEELKELRKKTP